MIELIIETYKDADKITQLFMMGVFIFGVYSFLKKILIVSLTYFLFSCSIFYNNGVKNMKAIMYVSLLWVVLGVLISFVAV